MTLFILLLLLLLPLHAWGAGLQQVLGVNLDLTTPSIPPCSVFGYSVETTVTLPAGFNEGRFLRVDGENNYGFAVTEDGLSSRMVVFGLDTLTIYGTRLLTTFPGDYRNAQRLQGDISEGKLFLFREQLNAAPLCISGTGNCISASRWSPTGPTLELEVIDVAEVANVDDARDDGVGNYLVVDASSMPGTRELRLFSKLTMARTATGSFLGNTTFGRITLDTLGGSNASFATQATSVIPNVFRVPVGGAVVVGTSSFVSSMTDHFPAATYTALRDDTDVPAWIGESDTR